MPASVAIPDRPAEDEQELLGLPGGEPRPLGGTLTFIGGLIVFVILPLSGVPWPIALLIAGIFQTGVTLYFLLQYAANPNFKQ